MKPSETKTEKARALLQSGKAKEALSIVKRFRLGVTKDQRSEMERAWECIVRPGSYARLGYDESETIRKGIRAMGDLLHKAQAKD